MSAEIVPFLYESHPVRVVTGADGEPWFVAKDVLAILDVDRTSLERLDDDEKGVDSIHTPGGIQEMATVSEPGLFSLVLGSRKPEAKRFKRWVTHEVLPTIRKTGRYEAPGVQSVQAPILPATDQVSRHLELARLMPTLVVGLQPAMAVAVALDAIHRDTGLTTEPYRKLLPAASEPPGRLNATAVGKAIGVSARKANALLEAHGWQRRNERGEWELTPTGQELGEAVPFTRGGHSGYQLLWKPEVVDLLP